MPRAVKVREETAKTYRLTVTLTQAAHDLMQSECEYRRGIEGSRVVPARIVNELILRHLGQRNRNGSARPSLSPPGKRSQHPAA